jgi:hypothetical protein
MGLPGAGAAEELVLLGEGRARETEAEQKGQSANQHAMRLGSESDFF